MKNLASLLPAVALAATCVFVPAQAQKLTLLTTNDTHSQIDPADDGSGGILRRKAAVDSVRAAADNVLLIDLGDAVQGTLYFNLYGGEVENKLMNALGYDIRILGNHEFDNGVKELARTWKDNTSVNLSTNYKITDPDLAPLFRSYLIKDIDGRRVGFIAINLRPQGMISEGNYDGVEYLDAIRAANSTAWHMKHNEGVDMVVALTHIGYMPTGTGTSDMELAGASEDIDVILGAHSHTLVNPGSAVSEAHRVTNAAGDTILVTQAGKGGKYLGKVEIDLNTGKTAYSLLKIDSRYDKDVDSELENNLLAAYRHGVDSIMNTPVAKTNWAMEQRSPELLNFVTDFIRDRGRELDNGVDFAIANKGGIRRGLPAGTVTKGEIQSMLPFSNHVVVIEISGRDIVDNLEIMTRTDGNGISRELKVNYEPLSNQVTSVQLNGHDLEPDRIYTVATIDYLANGGDYMKPLTRGKIVARSSRKVYEDLLKMLERGHFKDNVILGDPEVRMRSVTH